MMADWELIDYIIISIIILFTVVCVFGTMTYYDLL